MQPSLFYKSIQDAIEKNESLLLKALIELGKDVESGKDFINEQDQDGNTHLHLAAQLGHADCVEILLEHQAQSLINNEGETPLSIAIKKKHASVINLLENRDVNPESDIFRCARECTDLSVSRVTSLAFEKVVDFNATDPNGITALSIAVNHNNIKVVKALLEGGADVHSTDSHGKTALHIAATNGHAEVTKLLLENWAWVMHDLLDDKDGKTPLHYAAQKGHVNVVELLLKEGVGINLTDKDGKTALHYAAENGHAKVAEALLTNKDFLDSLGLVNQKDGKIAIHYAAEKGHAKVVEVLINSGAFLGSLDLVNQKDGKTALHYAAENGHAEAVSLLLKDGASLDLVNQKDGKTALHYAAENGHAEAVSLLLKNLELLTKLKLKKGEFVNLVDNNGKTALQLAVQFGHAEVIEVLTAEGVRANTNPKNKEGATPYKLAEMKNNTLAIIEDLLKAAKEGDVKKLDALIKENPNIDLNAKSTTGLFGDKGWGAIHIAAVEGHSDFIKILLEHGARFDITDKASNRPLHLASEFGHVDSITILVQHGARDIFKNNAGKLAHKIALDNKHIDAFRALIDLGAPSEDDILSSNFLGAILKGDLDSFRKALIGGADVNWIVDNPNRDTPLHLAARNANIEFIDSLLKKGARIEKNAIGNTPLHSAVQNCHVDNVKILLKHGAEYIANNSATPLEMAKRMAKRMANGMENGMKHTSVSELVTFLKKYEKSEFFKFLVKKNEKSILDGEPILLTPCDDILMNKVKLQAIREINSSGELDKIKETDPEKFEKIKKSGSYVLIELNKIRDNGEGIEAIFKNPEEFKTLYGNISELLLSSKMMRKIISHEIVAPPIVVEFLPPKLKEDLQSLGESSMLNFIDDILRVSYSKINEINSRGPSAKQGHEKIENINQFEQSGAQEKAAERVDVPIATEKKQNSDEIQDEVMNSIVTLNIFDCACKNNVLYAEFLIKCGANINSRIKESDKSPLCYAAEKGHTEFVKLLIKAGANADAVSKEGNAPLHYAADNGHTEVVKLLINEKRVNVDAVDIEGNTPLHRAADKGRTEVIETLLKAGAKTNVKNKGDRIPLQVAILSGQTSAQNILKQDREKKLKRKKEELQLNTDLHRAAAKGNTKIVEVLIISGVDIEKENVNGSTALHFAAQNGKTKVVELLIKKGANFDAVDIEGNTPLHLAAEKGHTEVIESLLKAGANNNVKNKGDWIPIQVALIKGQTSAQNVLAKAEKIKLQNKVEEWLRKTMPSTSPEEPDGSSKWENGPAKGGRG